MLFRKLVAAAALLLALSSATTFALPLGSGTLSVEDGEIFATGPWQTGNFSITYDVNLDENTGFVTYLYTLNVPSKDISHFIFEVSENFSATELISADTEAGKSPSGSPQTFCDGCQGGSNPGMPNPIYGYKFDDLTGTGTLTFTVVTPRLPMLGSFYSKDGQSDGLEVYAYNTGLTGEGAYVMVPDTENSAPIPEPMTLFLLGPAALAIFRARRR